MAHIIKVYEQCINNPQILQQGDQYLTEYILHTPDFCLLSLQAVFDTSVEIRKYICVLLKNAMLMNWEQVEQKQQILDTLLQGLFQEQNETISELLSILLCEIVRREECFQVVNSLLLNVNPLIINTLIYLYSHLDDRLNQYANQVLQIMLTQQSAKSFQLVYYVIRSFSHCEETDQELLHNAFNSTFQSWIIRYADILQQNNPEYLEHQIVCVKTLSLIFKDLRKYSKVVRQSLLPLILEFVKNLACIPCVIEDVDYYDDWIDTKPTYESLIYFTLQLISSLSISQINNQLIFTALIQFLNIPHKQQNADMYIDNDDPSIKQSVLLLFEQLLTNTKTQAGCKQFLLVYLNQPIQVESKYILIENYVHDLVEQSYYHQIVDALNNEQPTLRNIHTATSVYIQSVNNEQQFTTMLQRCVQFIPQPLGIVALYNVGRLCANAYKNQSLSVQLCETLKNQLVFELPTVDQDTAHLLFDSLLQVIKLTKTQHFPILSSIRAYWTEYPHDQLLSQIFLEIIDELGNTQWQQIYDTFKDTHGQIWLRVLLVLAKKQPQQLGHMISSLCQFMVQNQNIEFLCQATMLLKTLLQFNNIDNATLQQAISVLNFLLTTHQDIEIEAQTEHCHDLLLIIWNKYSSRQFNSELVAKIIYKLNSTETPSTVSGLCTILSAMYIINPSIFAIIINNTELAQAWLNKWLRFTLVFHGNNQLQLQQQALYLFSFKAELDQLFYIDAFTQKVIPLKAKILEVLIQHRKQNKTVQLEDPTDDDFLDVNPEEPEFEQDVGSLNDLINTPTISLTHLLQFRTQIGKEYQQQISTQV